MNVLQVLESCIIIIVFKEYILNKKELSSIMRRAFFFYFSLIIKLLILLYFSIFFYKHFIYMTTFSFYDFESALLYLKEATDLYYNDESFLTTFSETLAESLGNVGLDPNWPSILTKADSFPSNLDLTETGGIEMLYENWRMSILLNAAFCYAVDLDFNNIPYDYLFYMTEDERMNAILYLQNEVSQRYQLALTNTYCSICLSDFYNFWLNNVVRIHEIRFNLVTLYTYLFFDIIILLFISLYNIKEYSLRFRYKLIVFLSIIFIGLAIMKLVQIVNVLNVSPLENVIPLNDFMVSSITLHYGQLFMCFIFMFILIRMLFDSDDTQIDLVLPIAMFGCVYFNLWLMLISNLFVFYLMLELQAFFIYVILRYLGFLQTKALALRYFIISSIGSCLFIYGVSYIYGGIGSVSMVDLLVYLNNILETPHLFIGILFMLAGILVKLGVFPFHTWMIDIYQHAALNVVFFISILPKIPFLYLLVYLVYILVQAYYSYFYFILMIILPWCLVLTMCVSAFFGLYTRKLLVLIAYSSLINFSNIILGLISGSLDGIVGGVFYLLTYTIGTILLFLSFSLVKENNNRIINDITSLFVLKNKNFWICILLIVAFLSFAGVPPFPGFFAKLLILRSLFNLENYLLYFLVLIFNLIGVVPYIRIIRMMIMSENLAYAGNLGFRNQWWLYFFIVIVGMITFWFMFHQLFIYDWLWDFFTSISFSKWK